MAVDQVSPPPPPPLTARMVTPCRDRWGRAAIDNIRFWDIGKSGGRLAVVEKSIYSAEYQRLCALLRELRLEAGLTQVQVAERLEVPQSFVSKYESGERRLDVIELRHVARAIGVSVQSVIERLEAG
jgi:DNA-binding XRE family transcriptional regulator